MSQPYPKRLIEVDLPIRRISAHSRREKSIRHGHISTLHIWWARRPLAACRAVICAALWPDPADPLCPQAFRDEAARLINAFAKKADSDMKLLATSSEESKARWAKLAKTTGTIDPKNAAHQVELRAALLDFIADFANWDNSTVKEYLETSRALTQAAHEALGGAPGTRPLVVDPFAGGGSIPLEALRVGADAFASDLNPVAVLLNKVVLEYIPKYGQRLADEVRKWGAWIKSEAEKELAEFYPTDSDGAVPIAYIWARTITCEGPGCGATVPLLRSLWMSKRGKHPVALRVVPRLRANRVDFDLVAHTKTGDVGEGTVRRGSVTCPVCGYTTAVASVRRQLNDQRGGADNAQLCCVVTTRPGQQGRFYRVATQRDLNAVEKAGAALQESKTKHTGAMAVVPDEILPVMSGVFNAPIYGHKTWGSLFSRRQALAMVTLASFVKQVGKIMGEAGDGDLALAVQTLLAFALDKQADLGNSLCAWEPIAQCPRHLFGRQAIGMVWDFAEGTPLGESSGAFEVFVDGLVRALENIGSDWRIGHVESASATAHPLPDDSAQCIFTDPPYYNAVPYADLSDFFYVWLKRSIAEKYPALFVGHVSPKENEICEMAGWDPARYPHKNGKWFEQKMAEAMAEARRVLAPSGVGVVVFAHKSTSGWESQLAAMVKAGWTVIGSWPIDTENASRLRAQSSAALASSVHLVCRPRENPDGSVRTDEVGDWRDVLAELPRRIHDWMPRLAEEGIVGADAIFACLGPALEVFSRYARVEKASGEVVTLREYLEQVWAAVSNEALSLIFKDADAASLEPDARLTAMWLWTLGAGGNGDAAGADDEAEPNEGDEEKSSGSGKTGTGGYTLEYDAARKIAQGLGIHLEQIESVVEVKGDKARLCSVSERTRHLFGKDEAAPTRTRRKKKPAQKTLFEKLDESESVEGGWSEMKGPALGETVLDRVHQAMILFAAGRSEAVKRFLAEDGAGTDARFWKLAQSLSALYPKGTDEKRWVDGVLARKKGLGL
jgi:putative DNA methylase